VLTANAPAAFGNVNGRRGGQHSEKRDQPAFMAQRTATCRTTGWTPIRGPITRRYRSCRLTRFAGSVWRQLRWTDQTRQLFFFVDYLGSRYHRGGTGSASVFTSAMRGGDFSVLLAVPIRFSSTTRRMASRRMPATREYRSSIRSRRFLFANPTFYPLPNAGADGWDRQQPTTRGRLAITKANNQGDITLSTNPRQELIG